MCVYLSLSSHLPGRTYFLFLYCVCVLGLIQLDLRTKNLERLSHTKGFPYPQFLPSIPVNNELTFLTNKQKRLRWISQINFPKINQSHLLKNNPNIFPKDNRNIFPTGNRNHFPTNNRNNAPWNDSRSVTRNSDKARGAEVVVQTLQHMDLETQRKHWGGLLQNFKEQTLRDSWRRRKHGRSVRHRSPGRGTRSPRNGQRPRSQRGGQQQRRNSQQQQGNGQQQQRNGQRQQRNAQHRQPPGSNPPNSPAAGHHRPLPQTGQTAHQTGRAALQTGRGRAALLSPFSQKNLTWQSRSRSGVSLQHSHHRSAFPVANDNGVELSASPFLQNQRSLRKYLSSRSRRRQSKRNRFHNLSRSTPGRSRSQSSLRSSGWNHSSGSRPTDTRNLRRESVQRSPFSPPVNHWVSPTLNNRQPNLQSRHPTRQPKQNVRGQRTDSGVDGEHSSRFSSSRHTEQKSNSRGTQSPFSPFRPSRPAQGSMQSSPFRTLQPSSGFARNEQWNPWQPNIGQSGQSGLRQSGFH